MQIRQTALHTAKREVSFSFKISRAAISRTSEKPVTIKCCYID